MDNCSNTRKRRWDEPWSESSDEDDSGHQPGDHKSMRFQSGSSDHHTTHIRYQCTLPPTCHRPPYPSFSTSTQLESHHRTHHTYLCDQHPDQLVFPDERFLNLHFRECHDPFLQLAREQGKKTFACFEYSCDRLFLTPKARRLHLIDTHKYPSTFHFALPNHGLTSLYQRHGPAISLLRPQWTPDIPSHPIGPPSPPDNDSPMIIEPICPTQPQSQSPKPEPTSAIALVSGFDQLSLIPRQVRSSRSTSHQSSKPMDH